MEYDETEQFKVVNLSYTETASIVVKADNDEMAEQAVFENFPEIPDLQILSIEDADDDLVEEVLRLRETNKEVLN